MGQSQSGRSERVNVGSVDDTESIFDPSQHPSREVLAVWNREGVAVTDVYDILKVVGEGNMAEVAVIVRKDGKDDSKRGTKILKNVKTSIRKRGKRRSDPKPDLIESVGTDSTRTNPNDGSDEEGEDEKQVSTHSKRLRPFWKRQKQEEHLIAKSQRGHEHRRQYACKTVPADEMIPNELNEFINEIDILRDLDHPNVIDLFEVYHIQKKVWIVAELCTGGDLSARVDSNTEYDIATVMLQICRAVNYMHVTHQICHRDIKMENILYEHSGNDAAVKLIDFGLSYRYSEHHRIMYEPRGTYYCTAPEVLTGKGYTEVIDIWSFGVVAFMLLSGGMEPFLQRPADIDDRVKKWKFFHGEYTLGPEWSERNISDHGKTFVRECFQVDPEARWTASKALAFVQDEWIPSLQATTTSPEDQTNPNDDSPVIHPVNPNSGSPSKAPPLTRMNSFQLEGIQNYAMQGSLKKKILLTMAHTMNKQTLHPQIRDLFFKLDFDQDGTINKSDLEQSLHQMHKDKIDDTIIEQIFDSMDEGQTGQVHYGEFLAAMAATEGWITKERLNETFRRIDTDGKGFIHTNDLRTMLGSEYEEEVVNAMMKEIEHKKEDRIDHGEFLRFMLKEDDQAEMKRGLGRLDEMDY